MSDYSAFLGDRAFQHGSPEAVGVLLSNLGTPDAPTAAALRPYLRQFLSDRRVIELPRLLWKAVLELTVLPRRPARSAALYSKVWTDAGSPLLAITQRQATALRQILAQEIGSPLHLAVGMRYGNPSVAAGLAELGARGCRKILVAPLYPQYFAGTTGTSFDAVAQELSRWRWVPALRTLAPYHDEPAYIRALAASVRELWSRDGEPEMLLMSFHGIPERYFRLGDPYFCHCQKTARLLAEELRLPSERWVISFQSLFGREEWIKPYTDQTIRRLARSGIKRLDVITPGFSADCLETLEEIDVENRGYFLGNGGERFRFIPCLNDRVDHLRLLADLIQRDLHGWVTPMGSWDGAASADADAASAARADALRAAPSTVDGLKNS